MISLLLTLLLVGARQELARAQDTTEEAPAQSTALSYGTPVQGTISGVKFQEDWTLSTASADRLMVRVVRTDGNLIPDVYILDANGGNIAQSYGSDYTYAAAQIDDFTLPAAGTYTVRVTRYNGETGETKGSYSLEVTPLGTAEDNPNNQFVIGEAQYDTPVDGEITATHWRHLYTLNAQAADAIDISIRRTGGTLAPVVQVLDANNLSISTAYNQDTFADTGRVSLPAAGQYTIAVSRDGDQTGVTLGTYELTVTLVGAGEGSPLLEGTQGTVTYDQLLSGSITSDQWYQDWDLTTNAGDTITLSVQRSDGDLRPEVILLGGSGQEINHGYVERTGDAAIIERYQLAGAGRYVVRVSREQGQTGATSGAYTLTVTVDGTGVDSPALAEPVGEVTLGTPVEGEITGAKWQNVWTFNSDAGGSINVTVERTDGTLSPLIYIRDANGQQLTSAYPPATRDRAEITNYSIPGTGAYQIVVSRESDQGGYTTGGYRLTVSAGQ
ncbi:MAG: pre-peptidase C-terminal domain-containing protein [Anaerolineae bacterium]